jgi:hypothetical protein
MLGFVLTGIITLKKNQQLNHTDNEKIKFLATALRHVTIAHDAVGALAELEGNGMFAAALKDADNNLAKAMNELDFIDKKGKR